MSDLRPRDAARAVVLDPDVDELEAAEELFAPRRLPALVRSLLEDGPRLSRSTSASS